MDELNGRMMACQILVTGLIARVANNSPDPLRFLTDFRDEIKAVVKGVNISGMDNTDRVRQIAQSTVDELFSLMKPPSEDSKLIAIEIGEANSTLFCSVFSHFFRTVIKRVYV